jgi:hypothetical protein
LLVAPPVAEIRFRGRLIREGDGLRNVAFHGTSPEAFGSIWVCLRDTEGKPGQSLDWQLAVRKGKDAKAAA